MSQAQKRFDAMVNNPRGNYRIEDVATVARLFGITCEKPSGGSHYNLKHPGIDGILTVPFRKPIKTIYIVLLLEMIEAIRSLP